MWNPKRFAFVWRPCPNQRRSWTWPPPKEWCFCPALTQEIITYQERLYQWGEANNFLAEFNGTSNEPLNKFNHHPPKRVLWRISGRQKEVWMLKERFLNYLPSFGREESTKKDINIHVHYLYIAVLLVLVRRLLKWICICIKYRSEEKFCSADKRKLF